VRLLAPHAPHMPRHLTPSAGSKKPGGCAAALEAHFGCPAWRLVMVGDRYFTDVLYGNRHGMLTVRPAPFHPRGDAAAVRAARRLEDALVRRWLTRRVAPLQHALLPAGAEQQRAACEAFVRAS